MAKEVEPFFNRKNMVVMDSVMSDIKRQKPSVIKHVVTSFL